MHFKSNKSIWLFLFLILTFMFFYGNAYAQTIDQTIFLKQGFNFVSFTVNTSVTCFLPLIISGNWPVRLAV